MAFYFKHNNSSWILKSTLIKCPHGFGTRIGGKYQKNKNVRSLLQDHIKNKDSIFSPKQIHSNKVWVLSYEKGSVFFTETKTRTQINEIPEGDALITASQNCTLTVKTADCFPIILEDSTRGIIAIVHSGWRGTISLITKNVIEAMESFFDCSKENIKAAIGPGIQACCYQIDNELAQKFASIFSNDVIKQTKSSTPYLNLQLCINETLIRSGLCKNNIDICTLCTSCNEYLFYSYRREKGCFERMVSFCKKSY